MKMIMPKFGLSPEQEMKVLDLAQKMFGGAKQCRTEHEADWRELGKYFIPHLVKIDDTTTTKRSRWSNIINNTCRTAVRTLAAGMQSGLTSPSRPWFAVGVEDFDMMEYSSVREWSEIAQSRIQTVLRRSNFYNSAHMLYTVLPTIGTAGMTQFFDFEDVMNFQNLMTGRYWIGVNYKKRVDRLFIELRLTVIQMVEMCGLENVDLTTKNAYDRGNYFDKRTCMMAIFPNPFPGWDRDGRTMVASNQKPFVSVYWIAGHDKPLKTSGYDRFPAQVPRWEVSDDEEWGIGAGLDAIGDTKAMQLKEREKAKGIQKMVNPPVSAPAEMRNAQFPISGLPGGVTYRPPQTAADAVSSLYQVNLPLQYLYQDIAIDEQRVNRAYYADLFLMLAQLDKTKMTATEVAERHEEKLLALGPVIERLSNEFLDPVIERAFDICNEHGLIPPPPEEIQGKPLKVEYISMLSQAQRQVGITSIERYIGFAGGMMQAFPEVRHKIDPLQTMDEVGNMYGVPQRIIVSDEKARQGIAADQKQMQAMQQAQAGMAATEAAEKLGNTPLGDSTVLDQLTGR